MTSTYEERIKECANLRSEATRLPYQGKMKEAREAFQRYLRFCEADAALSSRVFSGDYVELARVELALGDSDAAKEALQAASSLCKSQPQDVFRQELRILFLTFEMALRSQDPDAEGRAAEDIRKNLRNQKKDPALGSVRSESAFMLLLAEIHGLRDLAKAHPDPIYPQIEARLFGFLKEFEPKKPKTLIGVSSLFLYGCLLLPREEHALAEKALARCDLELNERETREFARQGSLLQFRMGFAASGQAIPWEALPKEAIQEFESQFLGNLGDQIEGLKKIQLQARLKLFEVHLLADSWKKCEQDLARARVLHGQLPKAKRSAFEGDQAPFSLQIEFASIRLEMAQGRFDAAEERLSQCVKEAEAAPQVFDFANGEDPFRGIFLGKLEAALEALRGRG